MSEPHLLVTKFIVPPRRAELLPRVALIERLNQICTLPLVLLSAGAGFGKTTLLSVWASQGPYPVAWLSLDHLDNDPQRFWGAMIAALRTRLPTVGAAALAQLQAPQPPQLVPLLTSLINDLAQRGEEIILILDDYHVIEVQAIHESLAFLLDHAPLCLHLVIASRVDPPLPLSRWRVRGQMAEIRDAELRLTERETTSFLREVMGVQLGKEEVTRLAERTEGWIAGVQLAALSLHRHGDPAAFVNAFSGSQRFILDYVQEEILAHQPLAIQRFLMQTSVLDHMNAALCQAVTGEQASAALLERLERANLFLSPLDEQRQWYRFHPLFHEALLARLRRVEPDVERTMHERAARWYEMHHLLHEAIPHALSANIGTYAVDLIERFLVPQTWRNEYHLLRRWLDRLPPEVLCTRPALSLVSVLATVFTTPRGSHVLPQVEERLQWAEQGYRETANQAGLGAVLTARAALSCNQGAFTTGFALAKEALLLLPEQDRQWRGHCISVLGVSFFFSGLFAEARQLLLQNLILLESSASLTGMQFTLAMLGHVCISQGELHQAVHYFHRALAFSDEQPGLTRMQLQLETGDRDIYYERLSLYGQAQLSYEWNRLDEAEHYLDMARSPDQFVWLHILPPGLLLQVRLLLARGDAEQARALLDELLARESRPEVLREIHFCQAWLSLKLEDLASVQRWRISCTQGAEPLAYSRREEEALLLARLCIAEGHPCEALTLLESWKREVKIPERRQCKLHVLVIEALAHAANGALQQAKLALQEAVALARTDGYQRLFLDEGQPMHALLKSTLKEIQEPELAAYVRRLLEAFEQGPDVSSSASASSALLEPLTSQEQRVLRLLAQGATNQQIATQLVIELVTVKKHITNLLGKLGATNRTQAAVRARKYGLL